MNLAAIILGTDNNSYSAAASYHEAYGEKALVCGSALLIPFKHSKIANIYVQEGFSRDDDIFVESLEKAYQLYGKGKEGAVFFVPNEDYLFMIQKNRDRLSFPTFLPYPSVELAQMANNKEAFYKKMQELDISVPGTLVANKENYKNILSGIKWQGPLFMKAADYSHFNNYGPEKQQKGYFEKDARAAQKDLDYIYDNNYSGDFIVQNYVDGGAGSEYSIMGYRGQNGRITMVQARALLSDMRPEWVGNHLLLIDSHREDVYKLARDMVLKLDYKGFFNIDIKEDSQGRLYILECNPRLGRSFIYANLAGVNFIKLAIEDLSGRSDGENKEEDKEENKEEIKEEITRRPFAWHVVSPELTEKHLSPEFKNLFKDPIRQENSGTSLDYKGDKSFLRDKFLEKYQEDLGKRTFQDK